jgi:hypothetical protein
MPDASQMAAERVLGVRQHPVGRAQSCADRSCAPIGIGGFRKQPAGAALEAELVVEIAEVMSDNRLALDVTRGFECGERLLQHYLARRDVGLVEREHVERVAHAVQVASAPREVQGFPRRAIRFGDPTLTTSRGGHPPSRAPLVHGHAERLEHSRRLRTGLHRLLVGALPELRLAQPKQGHRFEGGQSALARCLQCRLSGRDRVPRSTVTDLDVCAASQRLSNERGLPRATRRREHRLGVFGCARHVAHRDVTLRAEVEEIETFGQGQSGRAKAGRGQLDGLGVLTGPREFAHLFGDGGGSSPGTPGCRWL